MKKILFLLAVISTGLLFPVKVLATQWVRVISTDELVVHIDVDSIEIEGNQRKFWQRSIHFRTQTIANEDFNISKNFFNVDCSSKIIKTIRIVEYDTTGSLVFDFDSRSGAFTPLASEEIVPGSLGDSIVALVCNRKTASPSFGDISSSSGLSRQQAINLISEWLREKKQIFSSPFNQSILSELTTGKLYTDSINSIAWLRNNNARYQYGFQKIESVEAFSSTGNQAVLEVRVAEDATLFINGRIDPKASGFKTRSIIYSLQRVDGVWKIGDY